MKYSENKHYNEHELRGRYCEKKVHIEEEFGVTNVEDCDKDGEDFNTKMNDDFREMGKPAIKSLKRLQSTPTMRKQAIVLEKQTGKVLRKLILRIPEMIPEVQREKAKRDLIKYQIKEKSMKQPNSEEECLELMMRMQIGEKEREPKDPGSSLSEEIQKITIGAGIELAKKIIQPSGGSSRRGKKWKGRRQMTIMKTIMEETADLEGLERMTLASVMTGTYSRRRTSNLKKMRSQQDSS
jgi:hypothetical protein